MQLSSVFSSKNGHAHFDNDHSEWNTILKMQYRCHYLINGLTVHILQYQRTHCKWT